MLNAPLFGESLILDTLSLDSSDPGANIHGHRCQQGYDAHCYLAVAAALSAHLIHLFINSMYFISIL